MLTEICERAGCTRISICKVEIPWVAHSSWWNPEDETVSLCAKCEDELAMSGLIPLKRVVS